MRIYDDAINSLSEWLKLIPDIFQALFIRLFRKPQSLWKFIINLKINNNFSVVIKNLMRPNNISIANTILSDIVGRTWRGEKRESMIKWGEGEVYKSRISSISSQYRILPQAQLSFKAREKGKKQEKYTNFMYNFHNADNENCSRGNFRWIIKSGGCGVGVKKIEFTKSIKFYRYVLPRGSIRDSLKTGICKLPPPPSLKKTRDQNFRFRRSLLFRHEEHANESVLSDSQIIQAPEWVAEF